MIEHLGIVEAVGDGQTTISVATSSCRRCHKESACGIGQAAAGRAVTRLTLPVSAGLQVGESVRVRIRADRLRRSAFMGYLLPPVMMLLSAALGHFAIGGDVAVAVGALTGFLFALLLAQLAPARLPEVSAATPTHEATPQPNVLSH